MKRIFLLTVSMFLFAAISFSSQGTGTSINSKAAYSGIYDDNDKKTKISEDQLPQAVKDALTKGEYAGWTVGDVYLISGETEYYKVELKNGDQKQTVKFDRNGNKMEHKMDKDKAKM